MDRDKAHQIFLGQKVPLSERHQADNESSSESVQHQQKKVSIFLDLQTRNITNQEDLQNFVREFEERKRREKQLEELAGQKQSKVSEKFAPVLGNQLKGKDFGFQRVSGVQFSRTGSKEVKDDINLNSMKPDMEYKLASRTPNTAARRGMPAGYTQSLLIKSKPEVSQSIPPKPNTDKSPEAPLAQVSSTKPSSSASQAQMKSPALSGFAKPTVGHTEVRGRTQSQNVKVESKR